MYERRRVPLSRLGLQPSPFPPSRLPHTLSLSLSLVVSLSCLSSPSVCSFFHFLSPSHNSKEKEQDEEKKESYVQKKKIERDWASSRAAYQGTALIVHCLRSKRQILISLSRGFAISPLFILLLDLASSKLRKTLPINLAIPNTQIFPYLCDALS